MKRTELWPSVCGLETAGGTLAHSGCPEQRGFEQTLKSPWFGKEAVCVWGVLLQGCGCSWFSVLSHGRQDSAIVITNFPLFIKWNSCLFSSQEIQALALSPLLYRTRSPWGGHHSSELSRKNERP